MQNKDLNQVLSSQTKRSEDAKGILSKLFRQIMADTFPQDDKTGKGALAIWNRNMVRYLKDPRNRIPQNSRDMSSARGNLSKELLRSSMTWGVFEKAIRFLNPCRVRLKLEFEWHTGLKTEYSAVIHVSDKAVPEPVEDTDTSDQRRRQLIEDLAQEIRNIDPNQGS